MYTAKLDDSDDVDFILSSLSSSLSANNVELSDNAIKRIYTIISNSEGNMNTLKETIMKKLAISPASVIRVISTFPEAYSTHSQCYTILALIIDYENGIKNLTKSMAFETTLFAVAKLRNDNLPIILVGIDFLRKMAESHVKVRVRIGTQATYELFKQLLAIHCRSELDVVKALSKVIKSSIQDCPNNFDVLGKVGICQEIITCIESWSIEEPIVLLTNLLIAVATNSISNQTIIGQSDILSRLVKCLEIHQTSEVIFRSISVALIVILKDRQDLKANLTGLGLTNLIVSLIKTKKEMLSVCFMILKALITVPILKSEFKTLQLDIFLQQMLSTKLNSKLKTAVEGCLADLS